MFFDEMQEVIDWEKAVNSFMTDFNVDIYVTGSNSSMMSSEISTNLTGRYIQVQVFLLSFGEYLTFRSKWLEKDFNALDGSGYNLTDFLTLSEHFRHEEFARYLRFGGYAAIHQQEYSTDGAYTIVKDIYNSTIFTDIVKRNQIRKVDQLEWIVRFAFENIGRTFLAAAFSKYLKSENRTIDNEIVYNYLTKLENALSYIVVHVMTLRVKRY